jgi:LytR cell envelope-related transcriptional attenuator
VDHSAPIAAPVRYWRTAALVAAALAAVELAALVVVLVVYVAKPVASRLHAKAQETALATPTSSRSGLPPTNAVAKLARDETSVIVLNGDGIPGAAGRAAAVLQRMHYVISSTGNAPRTNFKRSLVMYRPGFEGEARRLARDIRIKRVAPLDGMRARDLQGAHLALILGGNAGR